MTPTLREIVNEYTAKVPYVGEALAKDRKDLDKYFLVLVTLLGAYGSIFYHKSRDVEPRNQMIHNIIHCPPCPPCEQTYGGNK